MSVGDFLSGLGDVLSQQFSLGDNKLRSLDVVKNGNTVPYGKLGAFANQFDQSAERQYTEEGMFRTDHYNPRAKQLEIWMQEPDVTILIKKRAFSSLADNYRTDLLDKDERAFLRATKFLFQNKCKQLAAYEQLTKIQNIATEIGSVDYHLLPILFSATDTLDAVFSALGSSAISNFKKIVDRIRTIVNLSHDNIYTTWTTNTLSSFRTDLGEGTGVIELTTGFNINTTTSINFGGGKFDISFLDPYELMRITHNDIEQAIADASNVVYGNSIFQLSLNTLNEAIQDDKVKLNQARNKRGANSLNFIINSDTFLGKRIRVLIDLSGIEIQFTGSLFQVDVDPVSLRGGIVAGDDGLSPDELKIFKRIIKASYNMMQLNKNSRTTQKAHNADTNALRKKMRLHYGSKLIIQPMDVVHIFASSKTRVDNKIIGGLQGSFNALGFLQTANKALTNLQDFFNVANNVDTIDKAIFVGKDFPNWLWNIMRNQFTKDKSGTQIFGGLVDHSSSNYENNGTFTVNISGPDNSAYFGFGVVNYKPALDVFNGSLYDPLTPFDIKFDRATGFQKDKTPPLLPENNDLFRSAFVKYKNGVYVGKKPTLSNFVQDTERSQNTSVRKVFYDPDGMVYKWKEGIGTLVMFGNNYQETPTTNNSVPALTNDPFAGQDIMNALSLLITGEPYNFATFYKAAASFDNFGRNPQTGEDPSASYFRNFQTDLKYRNLLYGNFVPFKKLSMDEDTYKKILNNQVNVTAFDAELNELLAQRAELNDRISYLKNPNTGTGISIDASNLEVKVSQLDIQIDAKMQQIDRELNKIDKPINLIGNDITLNYDPFLDVKDKNNLSDIQNSRRDLRRRIHYLTRRLSWKVRANEDINLFIVDDSYDKDYDIQAFEKAFTNPSLFKSDYVTVDEQIRRIKELFDLEIFADTQGHIQIRPPQYNKIPSSVFYRMLRLKQEFDIQLYPQFLEDLYVSQVDNILSRLEILEDEIRMYGLALGLSSDGAIEQFLSTQTQSIQANRSTTPFKFVSDEGTGATKRIVLPDLSAAANPDQAAQVFANGLNASNSISTQATINNILSVSTRVTLLKQTADTFAIRGSTLNAILSSQNTSVKRDQIAARLQTKTGQTFDLTQLFPNSNKLLGGKAISQVDLFKVLGEMTSRIEERQRILKIAAAAIKNAQEGLSLIQNKNNEANKLLAPNLLNNSKIPQALENMIEDESYDDYGPDSGKRYVLKNHHIKSMSISESAPKYTALEVHGKFGDNFAYNLPQDLDGFVNGGGNALTTATAVDYDMWRMYGIRLPQAISAPYLTDPETQCAPFAVALLNKARKQIHSGTINIIGNEFMQPGDVVYIENNDMLFYVESVNHRISFGKDFSTSLNVSYGHMPGEYIPTYLDTVGKILYKNRDIPNMVNVRQGNVNSEEHIGTIVGDLNPTLLFAPSPSESIMQGTFGNSNRQTLNLILEAAETAFSVSGANYQPYVELRIFYASQSGFPSASDNAMQLATTIRDYLLGANNMYELSKTKQPETWLKNFANFITVATIDSDDPEEFRAPSSQAFGMARASQTKKSTKSANNSAAIDKLIHNNVIDCWIYFKQT